MDSPQRGSGRFFLFGTPSNAAPPVSGESELSLPTPQPSLCSQDCLPSVTGQAPGPHLPPRPGLRGLARLIISLSPKARSDAGLQGRGFLLGWTAAAVPALELSQLGPYPTSPHASPGTKN